MTVIATLIAALLAGTHADGSAPQDAPPQYPQWKGALTIGANFTEGNSVTSSANANFNAERRAEEDRWTFDAFWNWGTQAGTKSSNPTPNEDDTELSQRNYGGGVKYDRFLEPKVYAFGNGSAKADDVAELDYRYILGAGMGYQWSETEKTKWGTEAGLSLVQEDFFDNDESTRFLAVRLASNLAYQISKSSSFEQVAEVLPSLSGAEDLIAKVDNRLKLIVTGKWIAQIQYVLDFDDSTPTGVEEADHRVVASLGWSFGP